MVKAMQNIVAIIYDKDEFLILKKKGTWIGWQFVQGEKEKGEEWEDAVKRYKNHKFIKVDDRHKELLELEKEIFSKLDIKQEDLKELVEKGD